MKRWMIGISGASATARGGVERAQEGLSRAASGAMDALHRLGRRQRRSSLVSGIEPANLASDARRSRRSYPESLGVARSGAARWLAISGIALLSYLVVSTTDWILGIASRSPTLAAMAAASVVAAIVAGTLAVRAELGAVARLKAHVAIHDFFSVPCERTIDPDARARLREWLRTIPATDAHSEIEAGLAADIPAGSVADLVETHILRDMDRLAVERIRLAVLHVFGLVALSPTPITDTALFAWRALRLVREIAVIYGLRPSAFGTLWLLRQVISDAALIAAADLAADAMATLLGDKLVARLSSPLAEGSLAAYRMARFGLLTIERCRSIPFKDGERLGLRSVANGDLS
jgi:putative membrane protein